MVILIFVYSEAGVSDGYSSERTIGETSEAYCHDRIIAFFCGKPHVFPDATNNTYSIGYVFSVVNVSVLENRVNHTFVILGTSVQWMNDS